MLELQNISLQYDGFAIDDVSMEVESGSYFCLLGESGSGKSLILEMIAGIINPTDGHILWNNQPINHLPVQKRPVSLMFQDFALFPHKSVYQNLAFALRKNDLPKSENDKNNQDIATELNIHPLLSRMPATLSEGEQQRVALARAVLHKADILLLDEPMASVDVKIKPAIKTLLRKLNKQGQTIIHVTHDYEEALALSDTTAIISKGKIIDMGSTLEVFRKPRSEFAARMQGFKNFLKAGIKYDAEKNEKIAFAGPVEFVVSSATEEAEGFILIHDSDIVLSQNKLESSACNNFLARVEELYPAPSGFEVRLYIGLEIIASLTAESVEKLDLKPGNKIWISIKATAIKFYNL